ncbi:MAG: LacI family DNA-binding transcriptional regulator [Candidatus Omnitrophota bacterium]
MTKEILMKQDKKLIRIHDIAKTARVSISTVSRVMNNLPTVREENRHRVLKVIKECNYRPNVNARRLAGARNNTIGLIMPYFQGMFSSYYVMQLIKGVEEEAHNQGLDVLINVNRRNESEESFYNRILNKTYVEGAIYAGTKNIVPMFEAEDVPYIVVNMSIKKKDVNCIYIENKEGAFEMVEYLIKLGHKKIAVIAGTAGVKAADDRLKGYRLALQKNELDKINPGYFVVRANFNKRTAYEETLKLLSREDRPTAVFASSDDMAVAVIKAVKEKGLNVPKDVAVVGFDNRPFSEDVEPKLTTVNQPIAEMGRLAVQALNEIILGQKIEKVKIALKANLIIRKSCGA